LLARRVTIPQQLSGMKVNAMRRYALLIVALVPLLLLGVAGCGGDNAAAKPKVIKGGLDPEKGKSEKDFKSGPLS